ncbi:MAG TPA: TetR/AcrR family transcriptional regulator [Rhizobiaceae bacterium]|nr:TetR/AcrR family transcriptional regulator [Rhizobiaceae bacterium]
MDDIRSTETPAVDGFRLVDVLNDRLHAMQHRSKRARTRAALIAATALEMERSGFEGLTVARIADAAGVAHGTFYTYFANGAEAAMVVRRFYQAAIRCFRPHGSGGLSAFEAILRMNRFYVRSFARNARLLRAIQMLLYTRADYAAERDRINHRWSMAILHDLGKRGQLAEELGSGISELLVRSAIAMADELLREIYVHESASLAELARREENVAEVISLSWYRILYARDPAASINFG